MSREGQATLQRGARPLWFNALLLLDAFTLGGLAVWRFVLAFLETTMTGFTTSCGEIFHVLDKLAPYWFGHIVVSILLLCVTAAGYLWLRTRSAVVSALPLVIFIALVVWFLLSRG